MSSYEARWSRLTTSLRAKLAGGQQQAGLFVALGDPALMQLWSQAGADFVILDLEHSGLGLDTADRLIESAVNYGVAPLVRGRRDDEALLLRCLDSGAAGVVLPDVRWREELEHWLHAVTYPPGGSRGVSSVRVRDWGGQGLPDGSEQRPLVVPMIESVEAVERAAELFAHPGPDWWHIGLVDLGMDVRSHPDRELSELVRSIEEAARSAGTMLGVNGPSRAGSDLLQHKPAVLATTDRSVVMDGGQRFFGGEV